MVQQKYFNSVKISRILHAGYMFETNQAKIIFDPIFENPFGGNCFAYPAVSFDLVKIHSLKIDAVFISHFHDDHCSLESLRHLDRSTPIYVYCLHEKLFTLIRDLGFETVVPLQLGKAITIRDFKVTAKRALDEDVDSILHIQVDELNILNVVDSWIDYDMLDELKDISWDLILWPFQTMREIEILSPSRFSVASQQIPPEWLEQLEALNPRALIPSSCQFIHETWSWLKHQYFPISYSGFQRQLSIKLPKTKIFKLNPSRSIKLSKEEIITTASLDWVALVGEEDVDYNYDPSIPVPSTAEVALNFTETTEMLERVRLFCEREVLENHSFSEDEYFMKPKVWQLATYDSKGKATDYFYLINANKITKIENPKDIHWKTEIPIARLYGALEAGESLTSMYIRINDCVFSENIEVELKGMDLLQDPLLACLFQKNVIGYQEAQALRIKNEAYSLLKKLPSL